MNAKAPGSGTRSLFATLGCLLLGYLLSIALPVRAEYPLLSQLIIDFNERVLRQSLSDGSYRGEEGIMRILPEAAQSIGMKVLLNEAYLEAQSLLKEAEGSLERVRVSLAARGKEPSPDYYAEHILKEYLNSRRSLESAKKKFRNYRASLTPSVDERLNQEIARKAIAGLLQVSLEETNHNLREALGYFHNTTMGERRDSPFLNPQNVQFVNEVFDRFTSQAPQEALKGLNLDRDRDHAHRKNPGPWQVLLKQEGFAYISELEAVMKKQDGKEYLVDPLLFLALMRRESRFDARAVSRMGAAGLTQIMPKTAQDLGMNDIYAPAYFKEALSLNQEERELSNQAMGALYRIHNEADLKHAKEARRLMQRAVEVGEKKDSLFSRYRRELLDGRKDARLDPSQAIGYGYIYFSRLMKVQKGDISLALASYNAGPHRVREYGGIPPFRETVHFRNHVLRYYREYLQKMKGLL